MSLPERFSKSYINIARKRRAFDGCAHLGHKMFERGFICVVHHFIHISSVHYPSMYFIHEYKTTSTVSTK
jgi:hypothetical protein